ncbi:MAG: DUF2238 domain-containing protein [Thermodesulfovibrionia bacterium]|nr:DUF2238 domain-containing protein [Thermodesulfovibrionia bacterium]
MIIGNTNKLPYFLFTLYLMVFAALAVAPHDRSIWWAENIPIMLIVLFLLLTYHKYQFSNAAYICMAFLIFLHTVGGHYTFALVPFDHVTKLFGFERNHYDRITHFTVGFYAFPIAEFILNKRWVTKKLILFSFPIFTIFAVASIYEIIEWSFAIASDPSAGLAFLGSQGDVWDAQKDMLADGLGSVCVMAFFSMLRRREILHFAKHTDSETAPAHQAGR